MYMKQERESYLSEGTSFPVVKVLDSGEVEILSGMDHIGSRTFPSEPGLYQLRAIARIYSAGSEYGSWSPVYEWAPGIIEDKDLPSLMELPSLGQEPISF